MTFNCEVNISSVGAGKHGWAGKQSWAGDWIRAGKQNWVSNLSWSNRGVGADNGKAMEDKNESSHSRWS